MPNWVKNNVRCEKMDEIKERYADEIHDMVFSFAKVVPIPPEGADLFWAIDNWGTKWNAADPEFTEMDGEEILTFETAWSTPAEVFQALAEQLDCEVYVEYADEDIGRNCGWTTYRPDGTYTDEDGDEKMAMELWGIDPEEEDDE